MPRQRRRVLEGKILQFLEKKKTSATFKEIYAGLHDFSEQGIRNAVYRMIDKGILNRVKHEPTAADLEKHVRPRTSFELKKKG